MKKVERKPRKNCILCEKEINRHSNTKGFKLRRGNKNITCSKRCSRIKKLMKILKTHSTIL